VEPTTLDRLAYSPAEACKAISIGRTVLFEMLADGRVKAVRLGRRVLIPREELARLLGSLPDARPAKSAA